MILNGLQSLTCDPLFTRYPRKHSDCAGVLDYVIVSTTLLPLLLMHAFRVLEHRPYFSDHCPISFSTNLAPAKIVKESPHHFEHRRLEVMRHPEADEDLQDIEIELCDNEEWNRLRSSLYGFLQSPPSTHAESQALLDSYSVQFQSILSHTYSDRTVFFINVPLASTIAKTKTTISPMLLWAYGRHAVNLVKLISITFV